MVVIDVGALRDCLRDYYGTAMTADLWPALGDLGQIDALDGYELCELAEREGIDLQQFVVEE